MQHRFWRIKVYDNGGDATWAGNIAEISLYASGQKLTINPANVSASSFHTGSAAFTPDMAFDGDSATFFSTAQSVPLPYTLTIEFDAPVEVSGIRIQAAEDRQARAPTVFAIQGSDSDNSGYITYDVFKALDWSSHETKVFGVTSGRLLSGNATTAAGGAADNVVIFEWTTGEKVAFCEPDSTGDWQALVPSGVVGLTYRAAGCQPVTHGPYTITVD